MAKKTFGGGNAPTDDITHENVNSHLMALKQKEGVKIVAKPIDIFDIIPDVTQPRRAIPFTVRRSYENTAQNIPLMLEEWHLRAEQSIGYTIQVRELITGIEEIDTEPDTHALLRDYLDLISLAASIHREGLTNAITVSDVGDLKRIETGERRYLAHHMLTMYVDDVKYAKIAAQTVTRDVWRQASENGARKPLNAIGLARQLALLIMDMYAGDKDVFFDKFEALILPGECDRKFYAQVANGNRYRVKRGMSQRILDVTGLKNKVQISQYRNLLSLSDQLWIEADENDYPEGKIRAILDGINGTNASGLYTEEKSDTLPIGNLSPQNQRYEAPARPSVLPDRPAPSRTTARYTAPHTDDDLAGYDDIEPDDDYSDNPYFDNYDSASTESAPSAPPPPAQPTQADALIYAQRQAVAPTVRMLISYANQLNGQTIVTQDGERIFNGESFARFLQFYLDGNLQAIIAMLDESGEDAMRNDINENAGEMLDLFHHLGNSVYQFMHEVINTILDYTD